MPRLCDVLKNKNHGETPWERQQRLQIEDQIAAQAIVQVEAALEAEQQNEIIDTCIAMEEDKEAYSVPVIEPVTETHKPVRKPPPVKRKRKDTKEEKRAKE